MALNFGGELFKRGSEYDDNGALITNYTGNLIPFAVVSGDYNTGFVNLVFDGDITTYLGETTTATGTDLDIKYITFTLKRIYSDVICAIYFDGTCTATSGSGSSIVTFQTSTDGVNWTDQVDTGNIITTGPAGVTVTWSGLITAKYLRLKDDLWLHNTGTLTHTMTIYELSLTERG